MWLFSHTNNEYFTSSHFTFHLACFTFFPRPVIHFSRDDRLITRYDAPSCVCHLITHHSHCLVITCDTLACTIFTHGPGLILKHITYCTAPCYHKETLRVAVRHCYNIILGTSFVSLVFAEGVVLQKGITAMSGCMCNQEDDTPWHTFTTQHCERVVNAEYTHLDFVNKPDAQFPVYLITLIW